MIRFLVDAQLPKKLVDMLIYRGYDSLHTSDLPNKNRSKDSEINHLSIEQKRILITKDADFVESLLISNKPFKLLYVKTGNISNLQLQNIIANNLDDIVSSFVENRFVEISHDRITIRF